MTKLNWNIKGKNYEVEVEDSTTIGEIINMLKEKGAKVSKIICCGRILNEDKTFGDYELDKVSAVMVM